MGRWLQTDATPNGVRLEGSLPRGLGNGEIDFGGYWRTFFRLDLDAIIK